jgi:hypothetical protein
MTMAIMPYEAILRARVKKRRRKFFLLVPRSIAMGVFMENGNGIINLKYKSVIINHPKLFDYC